MQTMHANEIACNPNLTTEGRKANCTVVARLKPNLSSSKTKRLLRTNRGGYTGGARLSVVTL